MGSVGILLIAKIPSINTSEKYCQKIPLVVLKKLTNIISRVLIILAKIYLDDV